MMSAMLDKVVLSWLVMPKSRMTGHPNTAKGLITAFYGQHLVDIWIKRKIADLTVSCSRRGGN